MVLKLISLQNCKGISYGEVVPVDTIIEETQQILIEMHTTMVR